MTYLHKKSGKIYMTDIQKFCKIQIDEKWIDGIIYKRDPRYISSDEENHIVEMIFVRTIEDFENSFTEIRGVNSRGFIK